MRLLALVGVIALLSGCGVGVEESSTAPADSQEHTQMAPESWCRSYTTQQHCPKYICAWYSYPAPGYCSLPATSVEGAPEQASAPQEDVKTENNWPGEPECYVNRDCDTICGGINAGVCNRMGKCECLM
jgi:hypothetical protein